MTEAKVKEKIADIEKHIDRGAECATQKLFGKFIDLFKSILEHGNDEFYHEVGETFKTRKLTASESANLLHDLETPPTETPPSAPEVPVVSDVVPPQPTSDQPK